MYARCLRQTVTQRRKMRRREVMETKNPTVTFMSTHTWVFLKINMVLCLRLKKNAFAHQRYFKIIKSTWNCTCRLSGNVRHVRNHEVAIQAQEVVTCGPKMKLLNITLKYKVIKIQENAPQPQWSGRVDVHLSGHPLQSLKLAPYWLICHFSALA